MNTHSNSLKVECAENCGNSPKKELLRDWSIALAKNDMDFCLESLKDDLVWDIVGDKQIQGLHDVEKTLQQMKEREIKELHIHNIITHGNIASLNGTLIFSNNETIAFSNVYNFAGFGKKAKIKKITSYIIKM